MNSYLLQKLLHFAQPNPVPGNEKLPCLSNPIPYPAYLFLLILAFLVRLTALNNQFSTAG